MLKTRIINSFFLIRNTQLTPKNLSPIIADLSIGGFTGFAVDYFSNKMLKLIAFIMGAFIVSLQSVDKCWNHYNQLKSVHGRG